MGDKLYKYRFGIIGCGIAGGRHALAISKIKNAKLIGVSSNSRISANQLATKYPDTAVFGIDEMIKSREIDIICICSPNKFHAEQAMLAIKNQKHVIVEKPLSMKREEAEEILNLSIKNNVLVSVVLPRRFDKTWSEIDKLFRNKSLTEINVFSIEQFYYRNEDYYLKSSWHGKKILDGGILLTQGIHYIDLMENLITNSYQDSQIEIEKILINSIGLKQKEMIEFPDTVFSHFLINHKVLGSVNISTNTYPGWNSRVFISCKQGSLIITDDIITSWGINNIKKPTSGSYGWKEESVIPIIKDMINSLIHKTPLKIDLSSAIRSLCLTQALGKSIRIEPNST